MTDENNSNAMVSQKMTEFAKVLQSFGLNIIQSMGEMKHQLGVLTEKVEKIEDELIELKGLRNQLQEITKFRKEANNFASDLKAEMNLLKTKITPSDMILSAPANYDENNPVEVLQHFQAEVKNASSVHELRNALKTVKERLFIITGGHKVLLEIRQFERKLKPGQDLDEGGFRKMMLEKIDEWIPLF